jgi:RNase P subunit RPR2
MASLTETPTERQRSHGVWAIRHSRARRLHYCIECDHVILPGETYWRRYGRMAEAIKPFLAYTCEFCEARWRARYGSDA